jgi:hypothetical protein
METRLLIDAIVQQTTLLIAQLATSAGIRAPLAHIADQVFLELAREIEQQGVTRNVVADMFGMALRSYQKKVSRIRASATDTEQTLWQSILQYVRERAGATRSQVLAAFASDEESHVVAVLNDLVASGLLYSTGRGKHAAYGPTPDEHRQALLREDRLDMMLHIVWLEIADGSTRTRAQLHARFEDQAELVDRALSLLVADGRVQVAIEAGEERFRTSSVLIPVGSEAGWEAAVFDHFRAVCVAIAGKLRSMDAPQAKQDLIGGTTLCFEIHAGHAYEREVKNLLAQTREQAFALWHRVTEVNERNAVAEAGCTKVIFYFGQNVIESNARDEVDRECSR